MAPIHDAALRGDVAEVERLLQEGVSINAQNRPDGSTPLMYAAMNGHVAVVERLGADVGLQSRCGFLAVHRACGSMCASHCRKRASDSIVALLLDAGAPINGRDVLGETLRHRAAADGRVELVEMLLARGGDALELDAKSTDYGRTALHQAAAFRPGIVQMLLRAGANPTIPDIEWLLAFDGRDFAPDDRRALKQLAAEAKRRGILKFDDDE